MRDLLPRQVTVVRDGHQRGVDASELVPGDVVLLEAGDPVPAHPRPSEPLGLEVDTSLLTGESVPDRSLSTPGCPTVQPEGRTP